MGKFPDLNKKILENIITNLKDNKIKEIVNEKLDETLKNKLSQHLPPDSKLFKYIGKLDASDILNYKDSSVKEFLEKFAPSIKKADESVKSAYQDLLNNVTDTEKSLIDFLGLDEILKSCQSEKEKNDLKVSGVIVTNMGVAANGLKVIASDKSTGKDVVLGQTITDSSGNYIISYHNQVLEKMGKQKADIEIKIVDPKEDSKVYGVSSVHFNSDNEEKINLVLQNGNIDKTSEYHKIVSTLKPHIGSVPFKDLQENKEKQDISYLANRTGWDARLVAMVSLADKYSAESGIPPDFYHALFRAGINTDADELYKTNSETVKKIWEKSVQENVIDASLKPAIEQNLVKFKENAVVHILEKARPVGVSSLKDLLSISLPDSSNQKEFVDLYFNHTGDMQGFWADVETKFGKDTAYKLQLDSKLGYLTINNAKLVSKFYSGNLVQNSPIDLIKNGLYKKEAWDEMLNGVSVPQDMPGKTDDEKKSNYIDYMVFQLKLSYPTSVVAEMINNDELQVKGDPSVKKEVYKFLQDTQDKFKIGTQPLGKIIDDNKIQLGDEALKQLKKLERVYQISPSDDAMKVLWNNNLDSALTVIQYDEKEFIGNFGKDLGGEETAKMIHAKAHQVHSAVLNMAISHLTNRNSPNLYAISGSNEKKVIPQ